MKRNNFLGNAKNNEELINIIVKFIKSNKGRQLINSLFIVTSWSQDKENECHHEEADTRIILFTIKRPMVL